jgi:hypothetical protein
MSGKRVFAPFLRSSLAPSLRCRGQAVSALSLSTGKILSKFFGLVQTPTACNVASCSRNFTATSRIRAPPPSSPSQNSASTGAATISGQPLRNLNGATARELMQEHQRRLYESRKMKSRNAAYYVAGAVSIAIPLSEALRISSNCPTHVAYPDTGRDLCRCTSISSVLLGHGIFRRANHGFRTILAGPSISI